jgi:hypothetical protein
VHPAAALSAVTVRQSPLKHCARLTRMGPTCHMPCLASVLPCSSWSTCTNGQKTCTLQPLHCFEGHSCGVKRQTQHRTQCPRTRLWTTCCAHVISTAGGNPVLVQLLMHPDSNFYMCALTSQRTAAGQPMSDHQSSWGACTSTSSLGGLC